MAVRVSSRTKRPGRPPDGAARVLGLRTRGPLELADALRRGLSYAALERFRTRVGLAAGEMADLLQIPPRTLARRKERGRLEPDESDRLVRLARVFVHVVDLFDGDDAGAWRWLAAPQRAFAGRQPLELAKTDVGAREVEHLVGRLEHGIPT